MIHRRQRVATIARFLRAAAPAVHRRTRGRLPRQQQPDGIRLEYFKAIRERFVAPTLVAFGRERDEVVRLLVDSRRQADQDRVDASDKEKRARELIERAARRAAPSDRELVEVAQKFGMRTSDFQKQQLDRQVRQAVGVPYSALETPVRERVAGFVSENVSLIKSVNERYFSSLRDEVQKAFETGEHPETFAQRLADRDGVALSDARRIARDQIGKLNAQVNQDRQEALGVTGYIWRGAMDNRERDEHRDREGKHFEWDDPPEDGHPGEPIMCRCTAEPDFSDVRRAVVEGE